MQFRWTLAPSQPLLCQDLTRTSGVSPLLGQCLLNRGFGDAAKAGGFLSPRLKNLADPFLIPNMASAVERLFQAHARHERLVVFGDYDVDGITSVAVLVEVLGALGFSVSHYLPHRLDEGYGLSPEGVENCLRQQRCGLLLAVDCGSTAGAVIASLKERGIDTIVVDHHQVSEPKPQPRALVNPQLEPAESRRFGELCSVGLCFKLAHALVKRAREAGWKSAVDFDLRPLLDFVALGTIADLVPLTGENRILVSAGLERLDSTTRLGVRALKEVAGIYGRVEVYEVGFQLAPRLNAAGRLETASDALKLLLSRDPAEAERIARELDAQNQRRQGIEQSIVEDVMGTVRSTFDPARDFVLVEGQLLWHVGVVGIVASRILREFYRPTIIVGGEGTEWRGSGRSIAGFDLAAALRGCGDLLIRHGGHAMAAGLTIHSDNLPKLRQRLNEIARQTLTPDLLKPELRLDAEVELRQLTMETVEELRRLEPVGQGNPSVQLCARQVVVRGGAQRIGRTKNHLKLMVEAGGSTTEAVWWNAPLKEIPAGPVDMAFVPQIRAYQGRRQLQLRILDLKQSRN